MFIKTLEIHLMEIICIIGFQRFSASRGNITVIFILFDIY